MPAQAWALAMGEVLGFPGSTARKAQRKKKREGGTLCRQGFHAWEVDKTRTFDVKQGVRVAVSDDAAAMSRISTPSSSLPKRLFTTSSCQKLFAWEISRSRWR